MDTKNCPKCGREIDANMVFCPYCGSNIGNTDVSDNKSIDDTQDNKQVFENVEKENKTTNNNGCIPDENKECSSKPPKKKKGIIILAIILVIAIIAIGTLYFTHDHAINNSTYVIVKEATCTEPGTFEYKCKYCFKTVKGNIPSTGHNWKNATCSSPKTCSTCGQTEGSALSHKWSSATCTSPKKCTLCSMVDGEALGHNKVDYKCSRCGTNMIEKSDVPNILNITSLTYKVNYVNGIDQYMTFTNGSSTKTIKYIEFDVTFYNSVGDVAKNEIGGYTSTVLQYTGPLAPKKSSGSVVWDACFYCASFGGSMSYNSIKIEYMDGSTISLDKTLARQTVAAWR